MEGSDHSLVPQWLKRSGSGSRVASMNSQLTSSLYSDHITDSGRRWSSNSKGSGLSRSYSSSERSWHNRDWEKDIDNFFHKDKLFLGEFNPDHSDYVDNILSNRIEKDIFRRSQSMNSGRGRETWSPRPLGNVRNSQEKHKRSSGSVTGVGIMQKTALDEEFPTLGAEDKQQSSSLMTVRNGQTSGSHDISLTVASSNEAVMMHLNNVSASASSIAPGTMGLSMAEALVQGPSRSHTPPQLSTSTQKLEEFAFKQSRLLIPIMPSTSRSLVANSLDKSKVKTGQQQYPLYLHRPHHSVHVAHPNSDTQKISCGNSCNIVNASRESNDVSSGAKDNLSPNRSRVVLSPVSATTSSSISSPSRNTSNNSSSTTSAWIILEKKPTLQTQSRNDFFKKLSRKSSSSSDVFPAGMSSCTSEKSGDTSSADDASTLNILSEYSSTITQDGNAAREPLNLSSNGEEQHSTNSYLYPDEEEIAFLRSLGWEECSGDDDEGLTEEEIQDFYEKYMKLQL